MDEGGHLGEAANPSLEQARAAFARGNYAEVKRTLRLLLAELPDGPEREQAEELWSRLHPDPQLTYVLVLALLLLIAITVYAYAVGHS
jgi:hypothetical protein